MHIGLREAIDVRMSYRRYANRFEWNTYLGSLGNVGIREAPDLEFKIVTIDM